MKLRNLLMAVIAGAALLTGCSKEVDLGPAKLTVTPPSLAFNPAQETKELTITATRDWTVSGLPDWIVLSEESGEASTDTKKVTLSVSQNASFNRDATLVFTIGFARVAVNVYQEGSEGTPSQGDGSKESPFNASAASAYTISLGEGVESENDIYIEGVVSRIAEAFSTEYGNASFYLADKNGGSGEFYVFRALYLGNRKWGANDTQIQVGDNVIVCGKVIYYKGRDGLVPETQQNKAYLFKLNDTVVDPSSGGDEPGGGGTGEGGQGEAPITGGIDIPLNEQSPWAVGSDNTYGAGYEFVTGNVKVGVYKHLSSNDIVAPGADHVRVYKSAVISVSTTDGSAITGLQFTAESSHLNPLTILDGGSGKLTTTAETNLIGPWTGTASRVVLQAADAQARLKSLTITGEALNVEGGGDTPSDPESPEGDGTEANPYNPLAAYNAAAALAIDAESESDVYIKGIVSSIRFTFSAEYGTATFNISKDGTKNGQQFTCYAVYTLGNKAWVEGDRQIELGDEVLICGKLVNYKGNSSTNTPETASKKAYIVKYLNGDQPGGDEPGFVFEHDGLSADNAFNLAEAIYKAKELGSTASTTPYFVKGIVYRGKEIRDGAATFELIDGSTSERFTILRAKSFGGEEWDGTEPMGWGDEVVVTGSLVNLHGGMPTLSDGTLVSWNGKSSFAEPEFETDLSKVIALADGSEVRLEATVVAVGTSGFIVSDGTTHFYVFRPAASNAQAGDRVQVVGTKTTYGGIPETAAANANKGIQAAEVTIVSSGNAVRLPDVKDITATFDEYPASSSTSEYIGFTGKLVKSGNYFNVEVEGATAYKGSIAASAAVTNLADLAGKTVAFKGFYTGTSGNSTKYLNLLCTEAVEVEGGDSGGGESGGGESGGGESGDVTIDFSTLNYVNGTQYLTTTVGDVTITFGPGSNDGKYYDTGTGMRVYSNSTSNGFCTVSSTKNIAKIVYTFSGSNAPQADKFTVDTGAYALDTHTWTGSAKSVTLTNTAGLGHWRLQIVEVTFEE